VYAASSSWFTTVVKWCQFEVQDHLGGELDAIRTCECSGEGSDTEAEVPNKLGSVVRRRCVGERNDPPGRFQDRIVVGVQTAWWIVCRTLGAVAGMWDPLL